MGRPGYDIKGCKFGKLQVLGKSQYKTKFGHPLWECKCDCGNHTLVLATKLINGHTKSCGCLKKERASELNLKHNMRHNSIYNTWTNMKSRCTNPNNNSYKYYGGRGITICEEWMDASEFIKWAIESGYEDGLTIDRIDVNGNYEPSNCRWVTMCEQMNNMNSNRFLTYNGETKTVTEWSRIVGINQFTLFKRLDLGWSIEKALTTSVQKHKRRLKP